jgi:hypothetical protein
MFGSAQVLSILDSQLKRVFKIEQYDEVSRTDTRKHNIFFFSLVLRFYWEIMNCLALEVP